MSRIVIIEGPDECGKTTLAKHLATQAGGVYWHCTASQKLFPALPDYHCNILNNICENGGDTFFLDRFWPSELAYGTMLLRPDNSYKDVAMGLHRSIMNEGGVYIFCFSSKGWERYKSGSKYDPAHSLTKQQYYKLYQNYGFIAQTMDYEKVLLYNPDVDGGHMNIFEKKVYELLNQRRVEKAV